MLRPAVAFIGVLALAACASAPGGTSERDRDRITLEEIESTPVGNAYDVVREIGRAHV